MAEESNFSFTTKLDGDLFTVRGSTAQEFRENLASVGNLGIGAEVSNMVHMLNGLKAVNSELGGMPVDSPQSEAPPEWGAPPSQGRPAQQAQQPPQQQSPWEGAQAPQQGTPWGQPPQQGGQQWGGQPYNAQPSAGGDKPWVYDHTIQPPHLTPPKMPDGRDMVYKSGVSNKTGKPWRAFMAPERNSGVDPVWIKDKDL